MNCLGNSVGCGAAGTSEDTTPVAAAASAVTTEGTELCNRDQVHDLVSDALLERV